MEVKDQDALSNKNDKKPIRDKNRGSTALYASGINPSNRFNPDQNYAKQNYTQSVLTKAISGSSIGRTTSNYESLRETNPKESPKSFGKIPEPQLKFLDEKDWKTDQLNCYVCDRFFTKLKGVFAHHCRLCGNTVCGDCSSRKMGENRVCDICYTKDREKEAEAQRNFVIKSVERSIKDVHKKIEKKKYAANNLEKESNELQNSMKTEDQEHISTIDKFKQKIEKLRGELSKKIENKNRLKEVAATEREISNDKLTELEKIDKQVKQIRLQAAHKEALYQSKYAEYVRLKGQKELHERNGSLANSVVETNATLPTDPGAVTIKVSNPYSLDKRVYEINTQKEEPVTRQAGDSYDERKGSVIAEKVDRRKYQTDRDSFVKKPAPPAKLCGDKGGCNIF